MCFNQIDMVDAVATETRPGAGVREQTPKLIKKSHEEVRKLADELRKKGLLRVFEDKKTGKKTEHYSWTTNHPGSGAGSDTDFITNISTRVGDHTGYMIVDGKDVSLNFESVIEPSIQPRNPNYTRSRNYTRVENFRLKPGEVVYSRHDFGHTGKQPLEKPFEFIKLEDHLLSKKGTDAQAQLVHGRLLDVIDTVR